MIGKSNKFEKQNKALLRMLTKKCSNSLYGGSIRKDIEETYKCVTQRWMRNEDDGSVKQWVHPKNGNLMIRIKDIEGVDDEDTSKTTTSRPSHLGLFILSHLKKLMNDVILALDGFENNKI